MSSDARQSLAEKMILAGWATRTIIRPGRFDIELTDRGRECLRAVDSVFADLDRMKLSREEFAELRGLARLNAEGESR